MFRTTFLGHQSWLLGSERTHVLVDPLLGDTFGDLPEPELEVYPPRHLDLARFPPIDAVIVTHEHEDHLHIPSIDRLDRRTRVLLSPRSSVASRRVLADMGFTVELLRANRTLDVGDLRVTSFLVHDWPQPFEWDVAPFVVDHRGGDGNFFTTVDVWETPRLLSQLRRVIRSPGVWTYANNFSDSSLVRTWETPEADPTATVVENWSRSYRSTVGAWQHPAVVLAYGGGFTIPGDLRWMNEHVWTVDIAALCSALQTRQPETRFVAPLPGDTAVLSRGRFVGMEPAPPFVQLRPREQWPVHGRARCETPRDFAPACGREALGAEERAALPAALGELAGFLYGGELFRALMALGDGDLAGRQPAFALVLRTATTPWVWAYDPQACAFTEVPDVPDADAARARYVAGVELWAADLLALLRVEMTPGYVVVGRMRAWNHAPSQLRLDVETALLTYGHPLRFPARFEALHRKMWAQLPPGGARVPGPR